VSRDGYAFADDAERERDRLIAVERVLDAPTLAALIEVGVAAGWRCWEVGAGHGSIARWLAKTVGSDGEVVATDIDDRWFEAEVPLVRHDVARDPPPGIDFDLIHARLLLEHLADPPAVIVRLIGALRPGGMLVAEDAAGLHFSASPAVPLFDRLAARGSAPPELSAGTQATAACSSTTCMPPGSPMSVGASIASSRPAARSGRTYGRGLSGCVTNSLHRSSPPRTST
jgi:SAM-dependent methyltransferase